METILSWPPLKLDLIDSKFKCITCKEVYASVYQADDCGCRYCYCCLDNMRKISTAKCPNCNFKFASYVSDN